ncbi:MAG: 7-carboxy-7-deazaguanine synthase QueE [Rickettsiaceae bacterium]
MFGKNPKFPVLKGDGSSLFVKKIFKTLQAEGPNAGVPAIFIRLGGCNLACSFCDTEFEDYSKKLLDEIIFEVKNLSKNSYSKQSVFLVILTGGEPFRQPIYKLCERLLQLSYKIQIETNGTLYQDIPEGVEIVCSPKITNLKYHNIRQDLLPKITAFKYIISENLSGYREVPELGQALYNIPVFVQAMDEYDEERNMANKKLAVSIALENNYRLSYQIHKELDIE